jgi:hypothetical protein
MSPTAGSATSSFTAQGIQTVEKMSGTIHSLHTVEGVEGRITLRSEGGEIVTLQAPRELLVNLQVGDVVEVSTSAATVTAIRKKEPLTTP